MKKLFSIIIITALFFACQKDETLVADLEAPGEYPEIVEGTSEISQIRYGIFQDYDIHIYYEYSGETAVTTNNGRIQTNALKTPDVTKADEERALVFIKLMRSLFDLFSDNRDILKHRRYVMIKDLGATTTADDYYYFGYNIDFYSEENGSYVLGSVNNTKEFDLQLTKECLLYSFFASTFSSRHFTCPENFIGLSSGNYYDELTSSTRFIRFDWNTLFRNIYYEEEAIASGFVHPYGTFSFADNPRQDFTSYIVWIISRTKTERETLLETNSIVKAKYDIVLAFMKKNYNMNLEELSVSWQLIQ